MENLQPKRGFLSTLAISAVTNGVGGLIWIGRPKLALALFATLFLSLFFVISGWIKLPSFLSPLNFAGLVTVAAIATPLLFRSRASPEGWHSKWYWALALPFLTMPTIAYAIRSLAYQAFDIPAGSMIPTLLPGDHLVADKSIYGYSRFSFGLGLVNFEGRTSGAMPVRGDVVIFDHSGINYIKRIIGLPRETVKMVDGIPVIGGIPLKQVVIGIYRLNYESIQATQVRETLPEGRSYIVLDSVPDSLADNTAEFRVPDGHYFMLGDHRDNSNDSRFDLGFVSLESIVGRADRIMSNSNGQEFENRVLVNANR